MNKQIETIKEESALITSLAKKLIIVDNDDNKAGSDIRVMCKKAVKEIKEIFDPIVTKAHAAHKEATTQRKKLIEPWESADKVIREKISDWMAAERKKAQLAQEKLTKASAEQGIDFVPTVACQINKVDGQVIVERWNAVVVDKSKIPLEYLEPDMPKLNACARAKKGDSNIPGVTFKCTTDTTVRT